jgi:hypothetical protein
MPYDRRSSPGARKRFTPWALSLERRSLLSGASPGRQDVAIEVPSTYISQQSSQLDVSLVRITPSGRRTYTKGPVTVNFTATSGSASASAPGQPFTPVNESVTFPAGQATETVAVPINPGVVDPGLVPVRLAVTTSSRQVKGGSETVYLASNSGAIPPTIIGVERAPGGIAINFSKSMNPATVTNIHNYVIKFLPNQNFSLGELYGIGLVQALDNTPQKVPLRRATYNPATDTVILVPAEQLGSKGSYEISSPASLVAKKARPHDAKPLEDIEGNLLDQGETKGAFSITISKGNPFSAPLPTLALGN